MRINELKVIGLIFYYYLFFSVSACDKGGTGDTNLDIYNTEVIIDGKIEKDHAEIFGYDFASDNSGLMIMEHMWQEL